MSPWATMIKHKWQSICIFIIATLILILLLRIVLRSTHAKNITIHYNNTSYLRDYLITRPPQKISFQTGEPNVPYPKLKRTVLARNNPRRDMPIFAFEGFIKEEAARQKVDYKLVIAQGILESGGGVHQAGENNYFGRKKVGGGYQEWQTPEEAIKDQVSYSRKLLDRCNQENRCYFAKYAESPTYQTRIGKIMEGL